VCVNFSLTHGVPIWKCAKSSLNRIAVRAKTIARPWASTAQAERCEVASAHLGLAHVPSATHKSASTTPSQYAIGGMPPLRRTRSLGVFASFIDVRRTAYRLVLTD
jgi:hypothetical protein